MCRDSVSVLNGIAFALLAVATLVCVMSFASPFWVYYPHRHGMPNLEETLERVHPQYPFYRASWRGLLAVCFKEADLLKPGGSSAVPTCSWFWEQGMSSQDTLPDWYVASQGVFVVGLVVFVITVILQSLYACCCRCCRKRNCCPTFIASLVITGTLLCVVSLALYGGFTFKEGELSPEGSIPNQGGGNLDWGFYVGIAGSALALLTAILFYIDGCMTRRTYGDYKQPTIATS